MTARRSVCLLALLGVLLGAAGAARAEETAKPDDFSQRMFAGKVPASKAFACFARRYDAAHLAQHPQQKVRSMRLLVTAEKSKELESLGYAFRLGVGFRNRPGAFDSMGECRHAQPGEGEGEDRAGPAHLGCSVDCEGGGISVDLADDNKSVRVEVANIRIWRHGKAGDDEAETELQGGADDRVFRLDRVSVAECAGLAVDREELAALRRK